MIQSVDRALRILTVLQGDHRMSLGEIAQRLGLPPSTVHGIIRTLLAHRMVAQEPDSGRYRLGPAVLTLGNVYLDTLELRSRVIPWAEDLARRTGLAVRTGVMLVDDVVVVHHQPRPDGSRQMPEVGIVIPAHACALGKAILAFDDGLAGELLAGPGPLRSMTGDTVTDPGRLRAQLDRGAGRRAGHRGRGGRARGVRAGRAGRGPARRPGGRDRSGLPGQRLAAGRRRGRCGAGGGPVGVP